MLIEKTPVPKDAGSALFKTYMNHMVDPEGEENCLWFSHFNMGYRGSSLSGFIREMEELAALNTRCKNPVFYSLVKYRVTETPNREQCRECVEIFMREFDIETYKVFWSTHASKGKLHTHILVNKINPETLLVIKSPLYIKANNKAGWKTAKKQGWIVENAFNPGRYEDRDDEVVESELWPRRRSISDSIQQIENARGEKSAIRIAQEEAFKILLEAQSWKELHQQLHKKGIFIVRVERGGVLYVNTIPVKLSSVSSEVSMTKLEARLGPFTTIDYDHDL